MPLLDHYRRGEAFDITKSEVVKWLLRQPEIQQEVFNLMKRAGAIVYENGQWRGVDSQALPPNDKRR